MKTVRIAFGAVCLVLLGAGYAMSQLAAFQGWAAQWAATVDVPAVRNLALILLLAAVALAFAPDEEAQT